MEKTCKNCGKPIHNPLLSSQKVFCSNKCKYLNKNYNRNSYLNDILIDRDMTINDLQRALEPILDINARQINEYAKIGIPYKGATRIKGEEMARRICSVLVLDNPLFMGNNIDYRMMLRESRHGDTSPLNPSKGTNLKKALQMSGKRIPAFIQDLSNWNKSYNTKNLQKEPKNRYEKYAGKLWLNLKAIHKETNLVVIYPDKPAITVLRAMLKGKLDLGSYTAWLISIYLSVYDVKVDYRMLLEEKTVQYYLSKRFEFKSVKNAKQEKTRNLA